MFCTGIKISFLEPEPVGAELLRVEPVPIFLIWSWIRKKNIWSRSRGKMARLRKTDPTMTAWCEGGVLGLVLVCCIDCIYPPR